MSVSQVDTRIIGATQFYVGVQGSSVFPTVIKQPAGSFGGQFKILGAAGSTVQIGPLSLSGGASVGGSTNAVSGYPVGTSEIFQWNGPASFYLYASGATATIAMTFNYTNWDTVLA